jgi:hypothetical protein
MSGIDEMPTLQCPICKSDGERTIRWAAFAGAGSSGNWCYLHLADGLNVRRLERKYLRTTNALLGIDRIKCHSRVFQQNQRHFFHPEDTIFKRVKTAILFEDGLMQHTLDI